MQQQIGGGGEEPKRWLLGPSQDPVCSLTGETRTDLRSDGWCCELDGSNGSRANGQRGPAAHPRNESSFRRLKICYHSVNIYSTSMNIYSPSVNIFHLSKILFLFGEYLFLLSEHVYVTQENVSLMENMNKKVLENIVRCHSFRRMVHRWWSAPAATGGAMRG